MKVRHLTLEFLGGPYDGLRIGVEHDRGSHYLGEPVLRMPIPTTSVRTVRRRIRSALRGGKVETPYAYTFLEAREGPEGTVSRYEFQRHFGLNC